MKIVVSKGSNFVNLYGDDKTYKPFPKLGDKVRDDGLVAACRHSNSSDPQSSMEPDFFNDHLYYGIPGVMMTTVPEVILD